MNLTALEKEIRRVLSQIERWQELERIPSIEKGIAMSRLQNIYDMLTDDGTEKEQAVPFEGFSIADGDAAVAEPGAAEVPDDEDVASENEAAPENEVVAGDEAADEDETPAEETPDEDESVAAMEGGGEDAPEEKVIVFEIFGRQLSPERRGEFINGLFKGDAVYFEAELIKLQNMDSLDDALIYIGEEYDWHPDDDVAGGFIELMAEKLS